MVVGCCAYGCDNRFRTRQGLGFYRFPTLPHDRRKKWIAGVRRKHWTPTKHSRIYGEHFVSGGTELIHAGKPVESKDDVDYIPTVFCYSKKEDDHQKSQKEARKIRLEKPKLSICMIENQPPNIGDASNGTVDAHCNHRPSHTIFLMLLIPITKPSRYFFRCLFQSRNPHTRCWSTDKHSSNAQCRYSSFINSASSTVTRIYSCHVLCQCSCSITVQTAQVWL